MFIIRKSSLWGCCFYTKEKCCQLKLTLKNKED